MKQTREYATASLWSTASAQITAGKGLHLGHGHAGGAIQCSGPVHQHTRSHVPGQTRPVIRNCGPPFFRPFHHRFRCSQLSVFTGQQDAGGACSSSPATRGVSRPHECLTQQGTPQHGERFALISEKYSGWYHRGSPGPLNKEADKG